MDSTWSPEAKTFVLTLMSNRFTAQAQLRHGAKLQKRTQKAKSPIPRQSLPEYPLVTPHQISSGLQKKSFLLHAYISR